MNAYIMYLIISQGFKTLLPPREAQAAEAWVKLADDVGKIMKEVFMLLGQGSKILRLGSTLYV